MPNINFIKKVGQESPSFEAIMDILSPLNNHAEEGRKFLCLVDHIVELGKFTARLSSERS